jgi:RNA polymerase sigma-70 factor (ECF subfamily)
MTKPFEVVRRRMVMRPGNPGIARVAPSVASVDDAFDAFWLADQAAVLAVAAALTGDWATAEDITQDAFSAAYRRWDEIDNPAGWVRRVVANRAASHWRRRAREGAAFARLAARPSPVVLGRENDEFWKTVRALPRRQAQVVTLRYLDDLSISEIAEVLEIAEGTVKATLSHARSALAHVLSLEEGP